MGAQIRRSEYFLPVGVLIKCFMDLPDLELFGRLLRLAPSVSPRPHPHAAAWPPRICCVCCCSTLP